MAQGYSVVTVLPHYVVAMLPASLWYYFNPPIRYVYREEQ